MRLAIAIEIELFTDSGIPLGSLHYTLLPYEFKQIDKIFQAVTGSRVSDGYAILRTTTSGGRFFAYASVIDNATSDPICVQQPSF